MNSRKYIAVSRRAGILIAALFSAACADTSNPLGNAPAPRPVAGDVFASLDCTAHVATSQVSCAPARPGGGALGDVIYGGQNVYVTLSSTNQVIADTFAMSVTVRNLLPQPIGTTDGVTADPDGVKVFFILQPVATVGSGQIRIQNPDGYGMFTGADQPFYRYVGALATNAVSPARTWKFVLAPGVTSFRFLVNVSAPVPYPDGWLELTPGDLIMDADEYTTAKAVVRTALGERAAVQSIQWSSSWPYGVAVEQWLGDTLVWVTRRTWGGSAVITATSGAMTASMKVTARTWMGAVSRGSRGIGTSASYAKLLKDRAPFYERWGRDVFDGRETTPAGHGFSMALSLPKWGNIWDERTYNTASTRDDGSQMEAMLDYLRMLPHGAVVTLAVGDDAGFNEPGSCTLLTGPWVERTLQALEALGARRIRDYCFGDSWAMVAVVGEGRPLAETLSSGAEAAVESSFYMDEMRL